VAKRKPSVQDFSTEITKALDRATVRVRGELDMATAPRLTHELTALIEGEGAQSLTVDLGGVSFIDSTGLRALLGAHEQLRQRGGALVVSGPQPNTTKLFRTTGLDQIFTVVTAA
jgi:anti-anti-sigma factor